MNLLYYNELDYGRVTKNFKKLEKFLANNEFKAAEIKKIKNTDYYRAKLDDTNRLLLKFAKYDGRSYILLLEVILNHEYEKSKFLRGYNVNENKIEVLDNENKIPDEDRKELIYLNKNRRHFHVLDKIISFDEEQDEIYSLPTPLIIIGSAGSGKTILTLEKLKSLKGNVAYISLSPYLVENAQKIYYSNNYDNKSQEVNFLSFKEYIESIQIPRGAELPFDVFEEWFIKYIQKSKIRETYRLFEEFKGVLTGSVTEKAYLTRNEYINLGVKQSVFLKRQREEVYDIFEKYLQFLNESAWFDSNILSYDYIKLVLPAYDFVVVDEVQDITNIQLTLILKSLKNHNNFILSGDSNQIVHPNFFSWSKTKTLFFKSNLNYSLYRILKTNYRNSQQITELANTLLRIKNVRFGSIDKESTYLIKSISDKKGEISLFSDNSKIKKELNSRTQKSTRFAILVMNNEDKRYAREFFKTPLIFSIREAKGLEYENIILLNFISNYEKEFFEITKGVDIEDVEDDLCYARARNKEDKDLEVYKFFINSLYVAITRAINNIYIIDKNNKHNIFQLLKLKGDKEQINIESQKSDDEEWLNEARKLELQGKHEQAQEIRDRLAGIEYISPEAFIELEKIALEPGKSEHEVKKERKQLFRYAEARGKIDTIKALADLNFIRAIKYMKEVRIDQKEYSKACRLNRTEIILKTIKKYDIDFRSNENDMTGIMLASQYGSIDGVNYFIKNEANIKLKNNEGLKPIQIALKSYFLFSQNGRDINNCCDFDSLSIIYPKLKIPYIKCQVENKVLKIGSHSMEYFLLNFLIAVQSNVLEKKGKRLIRLYEQDKSYLKANYPIQTCEEFINYFNFTSDKSISIDDFIEYIEEMPENILYEYRRKRSYVNSILSNNEVDRDFIYNKKLFKRITRGHYILNPEMKILDE